MTATTAGLVDRMRNAALLKVETYEDVEHDTSATGQAAIVVAIAAVAQAIGAYDEAGSGVFGVLIAAFLGWLVWAGVTYIIGDKVLGGTASWGELLRTLGFAQSPGVLYVLGIIPILGGLVQFAIAIWILVAGIVAIRQACDFSTGKAVLTALLGWLVLLVPIALAGILGSIFG